ncbi:MAG: hypothetical protein HYZ48_05525, partial [Chlamydiales bacterium]|nr:hypothetical protein [Chlamydiales bacterium]
MKTKTISISFLLLLPAIASLQSKEQEEEHSFNPSSRFQAKNGCNFYLTADFLLWSANTDGLFYAQSNFGSAPDQNPPNGSTAFRGHLQRINEEWDPGFRVGIGGNMPYDEWDIYLNWTWFHTDPSDSANPVRKRVHGKCQNVKTSKSRNAETSESRRTGRRRAI